MDQGNPDKSVSQMQLPVQREARKRRPPRPEPAKVVVEKPTKVGDIITIAQVRAVAELVTQLAALTVATSCSQSFMMSAVCGA